MASTRSTAYRRTWSETCTPRTIRISSAISVASETDGQVVQRRALAVGVEHLQLGLLVRVAHRQPHHEPVALRLGEGVGALHLDRVLGREHHERERQLVGLAVDGDLPLLHALEQRRLGLRRGPVDLVADDDVGEDRARLELELAALLVVDRDAGDVAGQQVGGELDAAHRAVDRAGQRLGEHRLADAGDVLDEQVALGEHHGDREPHGVALALDDALDRTADPGRGVGQRGQAGLVRPADLRRSARRSCSRSSRPRSTGPPRAHLLRTAVTRVPGSAGSLASQRAARWACVITISLRSPPSGAVHARRDHEGGHGGRQAGEDQRNRGYDVLGRRDGDNRTCPERQQRYAEPPAPRAARHDHGVGRAGRGLLAGRQRGDQRDDQARRPTSVCSGRHRRRRPGRRRAAPPPSSASTASVPASRHAQQRPPRRRRARSRRPAPGPAGWGRAAPRRRPRRCPSRPRRSGGRASEQHRAAERRSSRRPRPGGPHRVQQAAGQLGLAVPVEHRHAEVAELDRAAPRAASARCARPARPRRRLGGTSGSALRTSMTSGAKPRSRIMPDGLQRAVVQQRGEQGHERAARQQPAREVAEAVARPTPASRSVWTRPHRHQRLADPVELARAGGRAPASAAGRRRSPARPGRATAGRSGPARWRPGP